MEEKSSPKKVHHIIGLMSGSSLDGLDIAFCRFEFDESPQKGKIEWQIVTSTTIPYPSEWQTRLRQTISMSAKDLLEIDAELGRWMGIEVKKFIQEKNLDIDLVASHGHTVFHYPEKGYSLQIGHGNHLAENCELPVLYDFRMADIAANGQGAPLAPVVDEWLFPEYNFFLNLGGIANIACHTKEGFVGYDVIGANQTLDALAGKLGMPFDKGGQIAEQGIINGKLFDLIQQIDFFDEDYPKSLDNQWVVKNITQPFLAYGETIPNKMATMVELIAQNIGKEINQLIPLAKGKKHQMLVTGGGAHNTFLMNRIRYYCDNTLEIIIPPKEIINGKESLLIALLGLLNLYDIPNSSPSVTGANRNTVGGILASL